MPPDHRKDPRKQTTDVVVRYGSATVDEFIEHHAHDVSKGGMFVRTGTLMPIGTLISFEIRIADEKTLVAGVGRVVWKRENPEAERPAGMGVKFIDIDEASQGIIDRLVAANTQPDSEFEPRPRTALGLGPALTPEEMAKATSRATGKETPRAKTQLGLAPAVSPASLVLSEQSSPEATPPPPRGPSTSAIDEDWVAAPAAAAEPTAPAAAKVMAGAPAKAKPSALSKVDPESEGGSIWPWVVAVVLLGVAAAYYFQDRIRAAGLFPPATSVELPPASTAAPPPASAAPVPPVPPTVSASASAPPSVPASASAAPSVSTSAKVAPSSSARGVPKPRTPPKARPPENPF